MIRRLLALAALAGVLVGGVLRLLVDAGAADAVWAASTALMLVPLTWSVARTLWRRAAGYEMAGRSFTTDEARSVGERLGIGWGSSTFDVEQFRAGMDVELEHGKRGVDTDVTGDDALLMGKIALAHLREFPDYHIRLARMEAEGGAAQGETC